jgi:predicted dehydrogenase
MTRFGIVGTGYWAETVHVPGLEQCPDAEIVGIYGRDSGRAAAIARKFAIPVFDDFDRMLQAADAVTFAVAPAAQAPLALRAAEADRHLLLEKPVSLSMQETRRLAERVRDRKLASIVFLMRRFIPQIEDAVREAIGKPWQSADVAVHGSALVAGSPYERSAWRHAPGAALWDIGPHVFSILLPVLGPVRTVRAWSEGHFIRLRSCHAHGAEAAISLTLHAPMADKMSRYEFRAGSDLLTIAEAPYPFAQAFARAAAELTSNISRGTTAHRCSIDFAAEIMAVLDAAARSIEAGADQDPGAT